MAEESGWVVAPDEARFEIAVGKDAKLSPEIQQALDQLAKALESEQEVEGYASCLDVQITKNCWYYMSCHQVTL